MYKAWIISPEGVTRLHTSRRSPRHAIQAARSALKRHAEQKGWEFDPHGDAEINVSGGRWRFYRTFDLGLFGGLWSIYAGPFSGDHTMPIAANARRNVQVA